MTIPSLIRAFQREDRKACPVGVIQATRKRKRVAQPRKEKEQEHV